MVLPLLFSIRVVVVEVEVVAPKLMVAEEQRFVVFGLLINWNQCEFRKMDSIMN